MIMVSKKRNTYSDWAVEVGLLGSTTITKQSMEERMTPKTESFLKTVVEKMVSQKMQTLKLQKMKGVLKHFKHVQIDDSTTLHLSDELKDVFPGNVSRGEKKAQAKIHAMYNLTKNNFTFFHLHSFSNNDQSLSGDVLPFLKKGDLCIRDLGFAVLEVMSKFIQGEIYFISRKKYNIQVFDITTKQEINILKRLRKNGYIDEEVLVGKKHQIQTRLVVLPIPEQQVQERKRKALKDRDYRVNHSANYYKLLGYNIFITNVPEDKSTSEEILQLYKLRWRIEIIFKSWKSCFSLEKLIHQQCKNEIRVKCIIYLMLIYIYLFHVIWLHYCENETKKNQSELALSLLKMANFFNQHFIEILNSKSQQEINRQILTHCTYDKRKDRENAMQFQHKLAA
jgi:hypothetical protein